MGFQKKNLLFVLLFIFPLFLSAQLPAHTQDFKGLWVTKFKNNVLGNTTAENNLLSYAEDNGFNYLICTNMFQILTATCGSFTTEMMELQTFIEKAHNDYGIEYISGNVGSGATGTKVQDYNNCVSVTNAQKFDMITYECEFYNPATNGSCPNYTSFIGQVNDIQTICDATTGSDPARNLISEVYIGGSGTTGLVITNSSEAEMEEIADVADHILLTYYRSTPSNSGGNFFNWTIQRLEWIASPSGDPSNIVLLLKSRDTDTNNMYDYIHGYAGTHFDAIRSPYFSWVEGTDYDASLTKGYIEKFDDGTYPWLSGIKVEGFTWFENEANQELATLPIQLVSFDVNLINENEVKIDWATAQETNNDYFSIERSVNGRNWEAITNIDGAGSTAEYSSYTTFDFSPLKGTSYYRLKQTDYDGSFAYSDIETISIDGLEQNKLVIFPNPSNKTISIRSEGNSIGSFSIYNMLGQEVFAQIISRKENDKLLSLNLENLKRGFYIIKTESGLARIFKN